MEVEFQTTRATVLTVREFDDGHVKDLRHLLVSANEPVTLQPNTTYTHKAKGGLTGFAVRPEPDGHGRFIQALVACQNPKGSAHLALSSESLTVARGCLHEQRCRVDRLPGDSHIETANLIFQFRRAES